MILSRVRLLPQQRYDLEDFNAQQSAARTDAKLWTKQFLSDKNSILKGFAVTGIGFNQATIVVADSTLIIPENTSDFSWYTVEPGASNIVVPDSALLDGSRNYLELRVLTETNTSLVKSFWDPSANSGTGAEFNQQIDTMVDLKVEVVVSTGGFSGLPDRLPLAIVDVDNSGVIKIILDRRELFFRNGNPADIEEGFPWNSQIEPTYNLVLSGVVGTFQPGEELTIGSETAKLVSGTTSPLAFNQPSGISFQVGDAVTGSLSGATAVVDSIYESFSGADKDIDNQAEMNRALMTEIRRLKNTKFWFEIPVATVGGAFKFLNSVLVQNSSSAKFAWSGTELSISDNSLTPDDADVLALLKTFGTSQNLQLARQDGTGGSTTIAIAEGEVLYIEVPASGDRVYSGVGTASTNFKVLDSADFQPIDGNYWIAFRLNGKLYVNSIGELQPGESEEIGDNIPQELLDTIGITSETAPADYSSDIRGTENESLVSRLGVLTDAAGDAQEDRSMYLKSDDAVVWSGSQLSFTAPIVLEVVNSKTGVVTQHSILVSNSPLVIPAGHSVYVEIDRTLASENLTPVIAATTPAQTQADKDIVVLFKRVTNGNTAANELYLPFIKQLFTEGQSSRIGASGSGSGDGNGSGAEVMDLRFRAEIQDSFTGTPGAATPTDTSAGKTDASLYSSSNKLFRLNYDASKTLTGTGTAMSFSAAPAYAVKVGDIVLFGNEARAITALGSINVNGTGFTIASAFSTNPSASQATVSQALYTKDLNAFDANGTGFSVSSQISDSISNVLVNYEDSLTLNDVIPDWGTAPHVGYQVTADNSSWSDKQVRQTGLTGQQLSVVPPVVGTQFRIRFFANKTSGSGAVNLLGYKAFWHEQLSDPYGQNYNTAFANLADGQFVNVSHAVVGGKSRFTFTFSYPRGLNSTNPSGSAMVVKVNGQEVPRFLGGVTSASQAYFQEISDTIIEMDSDYSSSGLEFIFKVPVSIVDSNSSNTTRIANLEDSANQYGDAQVVPLFMTPVNGIPAAGQFRSDITNRAPMVDITSNLGVTMGVKRMTIQQLAVLTSEIGSAGQQVQKSLNDRFNQMRFVEGWGVIAGNSGTHVIAGASTTSYMEVVFWGTGLNLIMYLDSNARSAVASVDGAAEGANFVPATASGILTGRNYTPNNVVTVASGLSLGLHTVRIRNTNASFPILVEGVEVLTETTSLRVRPGAVIKGKYKNIVPSLATVAHSSSFESGTLGTRGGNVVVYVKPDGSIGKYVQPTNAAQANLTSADHTNEEIAKTYYPREFGAGRSDDLSTASASASNRQFTLNDGVTSIMGNGIKVDDQFLNGYENLRSNAGTGNYIFFTFEGTGLDMTTLGDGVSRGMAVIVDGTSIGTITISTNGKVENTKVVSGLPYGSHSVRLTNVNAGVDTFAILNFMVYAPKKPTLPMGYIELAQYYLRADYVAAAAGTLGAIGTGVMRKNSTREMYYVGTWTNAGIDPVSFESGWNFNTTTIGSYVEYPFMGSGVVFTTLCQTAANNFTITIDGSSNLSGFTTSLVYNTTGLTFNAATGTLTGTPAGQAHVRISISGLTQGLHKIRVTQNTTATGLYSDGFDVISPMHSHDINVSFDVQNNLAIGSTTIADLRLWNKRDVPEDNLPRIAIAKGITSSPTSTVTTFVPVPDMNVGYYSEGEMVEISYNIRASHGTVNGQIVHAILVDGVQASPAYEQWSPTSGANIVLTNTLPVFLPKGFHRITAMWAVSTGTGTAVGTGRVLTVKKLAK